MPQDANVSDVIHPSCATDAALAWQLQIEECRENHQILQASTAQAAAEVENKFQHEIRSINGEEIFAQTREMDVKELREIEGNSTLAFLFAYKAANGKILEERREQDLLQVRESLNLVLEMTGSREAVLKAELKGAYVNGDLVLQCACLKNLAEYHLSLQDYSAAAKLLNGAIAICEKIDANSSEKKLNEEQLLLALDKVKINFLQQQCHVGRVPNAAFDRAQQYKEKLEKLRLFVKEKIGLLHEVTLADENLLDIQTVFQVITQDVIALLQEMVKDCIALISEAPPPCGYAVVGTGSLARGEMTPYSDLEYFILIEKPEHKQYFMRLSQLLELFIIDFNETDLVKGLDLLPSGMENPTRKGFSLDVHKNPSQDEYELIKTPGDMASFQEPNLYVEEPSNHLSGSLINTIFITGNDPELVVAYQTAVERINEQSQDNTGLSLRKARSLKALPVDLKNFIPTCYPQDEGAVFQVKNDLYRLPQTIMDALALHENLKANSTLDRIDELRDRNFILEAARMRLKRAFTLQSWWRLKTYDHYNAQKETIDILHRFNIFPDTNRIHVSDAPGFTLEELRELIVSYGILMALYVCASKFFETQGHENLFSTTLLCEDSAVNAGLVCVRLCLYKDAIDCFNRALTLIDEDPSNEQLFRSAKLTCLIGLGGVYRSLSLFDLSIEHYLKAIRGMGNNFGQGLGNLHNSLALVIQEKGEPQHAGVHYEKALTMLQGHQRANTLCNQGQWHYIMKNFEAAKNSHHQSLEVLANKRVNDRDVKLLKAANFNGLGIIFQTLNRRAEALRHYRLALDIYLEEYGNKSFRVAGIYTCLGDFYLNEDPQEAKNYYEQALRILTQLYGWRHTNVFATVQGLTNTLFMLGAKCEVRGSLREAKACFEEIVSMNTKVYGEDNPVMLNTLQSFGFFCYQYKDIPKALECFEKALTIYASLDREPQPEILNGLVLCYKALADAAHLSGNIDEALRHYETVATILIRLHGERNPVLVEPITALAVLYFQFGRHLESIRHFEYVLGITTLAHGGERNFPSLQTLINLGDACVQLERSQEALQYYDRAFSIAAAILAPNHPVTIQLSIKKEQQEVNLRGNANQNRPRY